MTKAKKDYKDKFISVSDGEVLAGDSLGSSEVVGKIDHVDLSIEQPKNSIGIYRTEHVMIYGENGVEL